MRPPLNPRVFAMAALLLTVSSALIAADPGTAKPGPKITPPTAKPKVVVPPVNKPKVIVAPTSKEKPFVPVVITTEMLIFSAEPTPLPFKPVVITTEMLIFSAEER